MVRSHMDSFVVKCNKVNLVVVDVYIWYIWLRSCLINSSTYIANVRIRVAGRWQPIQSDNSYWLWVMCKLFAGWVGSCTKSTLVAAVFHSQIAVRSVADVEMMKWSPCVAGWIQANKQTLRLRNEQLDNWAIGRKRYVYDALARVFAFNDLFIFWQALPLSRAKNRGREEARENDDELMMNGKRRNDDGNDNELTQCNRNINATRDCRIKAFCVFV